MRKLLIGLFVFASLAACKKDEISESNASQQFNKYRVKSIKGSNDIWGDNYTLKIEYNTKNQIDKIHCVSASDDTVAVMTNKREKNSLVYTLNDYMLDKDGKLSKKVQTRYKVSNEMLGGRILSQEITINSPKSIKDEENDNKVDEYIKVSFDKFVYEYGTDGQIINSRQMRKIYDIKPDYGYYYNENFDSFVYKYQYNYSGNMLESIDSFTSDSQIASDGNYRLLFKEALNYSGGNLTSVSGGNNDFTLSHSGAQVTKVAKNSKIDYTLNGNGFVTKIINSNGNVATIEYEEGHGNFNSMLPIIETMYGFPIIK